MNTYIDSIQLMRVKLPLQVPFKTAHGQINSRSVIILKLNSTSGYSVLSECSALSQKEYHPEILDHSYNCLKNILIPHIVKQTVSVSSLSSNLLEISPQFPFSVAAIEMGAWALLALEKNSSLGSLLGVSKNHIQSGFVIGLSNTAGYIKSVAQAKKYSVHKLKFKVTPNTLLTTLGFIKEQKLFDHFNYIALDGNESFSSSDLSLLASTNNYPFSYIEQPTHRSDNLSLNSIKSFVSSPVILDESIHSNSDISDYLDQPFCDGIIIKPSKFGGFQPSLDAIHKANSYSKKVILGGMLESGIGRAYTLSLASVMDTTIAPDISPSDRYFKEDICKPWTLNSSGYFTTPTLSFFNDLKWPGSTWEC